MKQSTITPYYSKGNAAGRLFEERFHGINIHFVDFFLSKVPEEQGDSSILSYVI